MNDLHDASRPAASPPPPERVPTLTEVVDVDFAGVAFASVPASASAMGAAPGPSADVPAAADHADDGAHAPVSALSTTAAPEIDEALLVGRVLGAVLRQVDVALEYRLREAMVPAFSRLADGLVAEARGALASSLREIIARSVAQELARHNDR